MKIQKFLEASALFGLYAAYDQVIGDFQTRLQAEDVHFLQALIVTGLFFEDRPVRPSQLAETLGASRSNISHAVRDLERQGLIERRTRASDARVYDLTLTSRGKRKAPRLVRLFDSIQNQIEDAGGRDWSVEFRRFVRTYRTCRFPK